MLVSVLKVVEEAMSAVEVVSRNATNATDLVTLLASAKRIKIDATDAMVLATLLVIVSKVPANHLVTIATKLVTLLEIALSLPLQVLHAIIATSLVILLVNVLMHLARPVTNVAKLAI